MNVLAISRARNPHAFFAAGYFLVTMMCASAAAEQADRIVVLKSERKLILYSGATVLRTYKIALGAEPKGQKTRQGDHRTPEGTYIIDSRNANSHFHRALHIAYPNAEDRINAPLSGSFKPRVSTSTCCTSSWLLRGLPQPSFSRYHSARVSGAVELP